MKTRTLIALAAAPLGLAAIWLSLARAQEPEPAPAPKSDDLVRLQHVWGERARHLDDCVRLLVAKADWIAANHSLPLTKLTDLTEEPGTTTSSFGSVEYELLIRSLRYRARRDYVKAEVYRKAAHGDYKPLLEMVRRGPLFGESDSLHTALQCAMYSLPPRHDSKDDHGDRPNND